MQEFHAFVLADFLIYIIEYPNCSAHCDSYEFVRVPSSRLQTANM